MIDEGSLSLNASIAFSLLELLPQIQMTKEVVHRCRILLSSGQEYTATRSIVKAYWLGHLCTNLISGSG
jgi:hypothetical protein